MFVIGEGCMHAGPKSRPIFPSAWMSCLWTLLRDKCCLSYSRTTIFTCKDIHCIL